MPDHLTVTDEDATRVITMLRPEKKNVITQDMYRYQRLDQQRTAGSRHPLHPDRRQRRRVHRRQRPRAISAKTAPPVRIRRANPMPSSSSMRWRIIQWPVAAVDGIAISALAPPCCSIAITLICSTTATFSTPFIHLSGRGSRRRLQPADAAHHGISARLLHAGDGPQGLGRGHARLAGFVSQVRWARPKPRRARWRAKSARSRRKRSRSRASCSGRRRKT